MNRGQTEKNLADVMEAVVQSGHLSVAETCSKSYHLWVIHTVQMHSFVTVIDVCCYIL